MDHITGSPKVSGYFDPLFSRAWGDRSGNPMNWYKIVVGVLGMWFAHAVTVIR